jgi:hypothetical protein
VAACMQVQAARSRVLLLEAARLEEQLSSKVAALQAVKRSQPGGRGPRRLFTSACVCERHKAHGNGKHSPAQPIHSTTEAQHNRSTARHSTTEAQQGTAQHKVDPCPTCASRPMVSLLASCSAHGPPSPKTFSSVLAA